MENKLDVMMIEAGTVIHFHGRPLYLTENTRVMGCAANFVLDANSIYLKDSKPAEAIPVDKDGNAIG